MGLSTEERNLECFKKKIRELGGDWAREDRVHFINYGYGEKYFHCKAEMTNLYKDDSTWNRAKNSYMVYVEINNATQNIIIKFYKDQSWANIKYFNNFKDLRKYLEENNYLLMRITNEHRF